MSGDLRTSLTSACINWQAGVRKVFTPDALWEKLHRPPQQRSHQYFQTSHFVHVAALQVQLSPNRKKSYNVVSISKKPIPSNKQIFLKQCSLLLSNTYDFWKYIYRDTSCFVYLGLWVVVRVSQLTESILLVPEIRKLILAFAKWTKIL